MKGWMVSGGLVMGLLLALTLMVLLAGVASLGWSKELGQGSLPAWSWPQPALEPVLIALSPAAARRSYPVFPGQGAPLPREAILLSPENGWQLVEQVVQPQATSYMPQEVAVRPAVSQVYQREWADPTYVVPRAHGS